MTVVPARRQDMYGVARIHEAEGLELKIEIVAPEIRDSAETGHLAADDVLRHDRRLIDHAGPVLDADRPAGERVVP
jgi:hypothetical protein